MAEIVCHIQELIERPFCRLSIEEKTKCVRMIRPMPELINLTCILKQNKKEINRSFKTDNYKRCEWLSGSNVLNALFCWPCLLFKMPNDKSVWVYSGFKDLNHLSNGISRHEKTQNHINSMLSYKTFGSVRINLLIDNHAQIATSRHNSMVSKNRDILKRLIDVVCLIGSQELALRGHNEGAASENRGNYLELLGLVAMYDPLLSQHLNDSTAFRGTSSAIQNDLINAVSTVVLNAIKKEISESNYVAILIDESTDVSLHSQMSTMLRYVSKTGNIEERFLFFTNVSNDRTASAISKHVIDLIKSLHCEMKLIAQSYDGAAVMAGELSGTQTRVRAEFPQARFIHCSAHKLNLVLSQSVNFIKNCRIFFLSISGIPSFFSHSTKRAHALEHFIKNKFPNVAPTRWNSNSRLVARVKDNRDELCNFFESIIDDPFDWDSQTIQAARGFIHFLQEFNTQFLLEIFSKIFAYTDTLFDILQKKSMDIALCSQFIRECRENIAKIRNDFDVFYEATRKVVGDPKIKRGDVSNNKIQEKQLLFEIIDTVVTQMDIRFENLEDLNFVGLLDSNKFHNFKTKFPEALLIALKMSYAGMFDLPKLTNELTVVYNSATYMSFKVNDILKYNIENGLDQTFSEINRLCTIILTLPSTTASVERSFSTLKRIKTYTRSTMNQNRLSDLAILSIEKTLLKDLKSNPLFYSDVINIFIEKSRRIDLVFK